MVEKGKAAGFSQAFSSYFLVSGFNARPLARCLEKISAEEDEPCNKRNGTYGPLSVNTAMRSRCGGQMTQLKYPLDKSSFELMQNPSFAVTRSRSRPIRGMCDTGTAKKSFTLTATMKRTDLSFPCFLRKKQADPFIT